MSIKEESVKQAALLYYNGDSEIKLLGGYHNKVFEAQYTNCESLILRFTDCNRRTKEELEAEINFLNYLKQRDVSVVIPKTSLNGKYITEFNAEDHFYISCFCKVKGKDWFSIENNTSSLMIEIGQTAGKIHRYSLQYGLQNSSIDRKSWYSNEYLTVANSILDKVNPELKLKLRDLIEKLQTLPVNQDNFGLIHGDYLFSNYMIDNGKVTVIDFDECEFSWFIYDIAVNLYYYVLGGLPYNSEKNIKFAETILYYFLIGYLKEKDIEDSFFEKLPLFMDLREFKLFISVCRSGFPNKLNPWQQGFIETASKRIMENRSLVKLNFRSILNKAREASNSTVLPYIEDMDALRGLL